jgi:hypothetical protein
LNDKILGLFEELFSTIWQWIIGPFKDLKSLSTLIYGDPNNGLVYGIFKTETFNNVIAPGMAAMQTLSASIILISIIMAGMKISSTGINPANRTYAIEYFKDLLIMGLLFFNLGTLFDLIFTVNSVFVNAFASGKELMDMDQLTDISTFQKNGVLGGLIIGLCLLGLWVWANFYYMMRSLTLIMLMIMSPLAIAFYLIPQTRAITGGVFKEFTGTVFVQSVHAGLYWVVSSIAAGEKNALGSVLLYIIFIPVSESIRSLLGLGGQMNDRMTKTAAMFGGAALSGVLGSVKGALNGQSIATTLRRLSGNGEAKSGKQDVEGGHAESSDAPSGLLTNAGDMSSTPRAERMLKAGEITSKMGKAVFGVAGAFAGSPLGPMGAIGASTVGFAAGGKVGGVTGRVGMATAEMAGRGIVRGVKAGYEKGKGITQAKELADEKLAHNIADMDTSQWASENKEDFMKNLKERFPDAHDSSLNGMWDTKVSEKRGEFLNGARGTVKELKKSNGQQSKAGLLVNSTTDALTQDWAKKNRDQFMKDYNVSNPIPQSGTTEADTITYNQDREKVWENTVAQKRKDIGSVATNTAMNLGNGEDISDSFINKDAFIENMANNVSGIIDKDKRASRQAVKNASSGVKTESIYNRKSVNTPFVAPQLARIKSEQQKQEYITNRTNDGSGTTKELALSEWNTIAKPVYQNHLGNVASSMPRFIPLNHAIVKNTAGKVLTAGVGGLVSGVVGATGIKEASQFLADTKVAQGSIGLVSGVKEGLQNFDVSQGVVTGVNQLVKTTGSTAKNAFTHHVATNVKGKQIGFRNVVAYSGGLIGGVSGYKVGAKFAGGGPKNISRSGFNPYNNAVSQRIAEISDIQHLAQKNYDPTTGQTTIADGAVRMVTTNAESYIEVRDVTGNLNRVSRTGNGDASLKKDEVIYQDLSIDQGSISSPSPAYQEDDSGGRVTINRRIHTNPNNLLGNNNMGKKRVVKEVQSYNQLVDSGQYQATNIMKDMQDVQIVLEKERSYLVGKDNSGQQYRISQYAPGDARLEENQTLYSDIETRNNKLVSPSNFYEMEGKNRKNHDFTTTLTVNDLVPAKPNKRAESRRNNERNRNPSLTGSLGN